MHLHSRKNYKGVNTLIGGRGGKGVNTIAMFTGTQEHKKTNQPLPMLLLLLECGIVTIIALTYFTLFHPTPLLLTLPLYSSPYPFTPHPTTGLSLMTDLNLSEYVYIDKPVR